jgi:flagellar biosynthetic protein FlhB
MADDEDQSSKTQDPTERKLRQLREEGNVPSSREVNNLFAILAMVALAGGAAPWAFRKLLEMDAGLLQAAGEVRMDDGAAIGAVLSHVGMTLLLALLPLMLLVLMLGYFSGWIQNGGVFSGKPIQPNLEKISPLAGFKRMFSLKSLAELIKSLVKMAVIGGAMALVMWNHRDMVVGLVDADTVTMLWYLQRLLLWVLGAAVIVMALLAVGDYIFQRMQYIQQHRMSHRELKDEVRDTEGDPHVKGRQRQIRMERARKRMMQAVPKADVVVTNPTHYACALRYKPDDGDAAPTLVAKGVDAVALRIREIAAEHNIPLYEDPPLARELFRSVEIDEAIPIELYEVVAKVMAFVMGLKGKRAAA